MPAVATVAVLGFMDFWNDFFAPFIYLNNVDKDTIVLRLFRIWSDVEGAHHTWSTTSASSAASARQARSGAARRSVQHAGIGGVQAAHAQQGGQLCQVGIDQKAHGPQRRAVPPARADDEDARLVAAARREQRIILTRDRRLLERKAVTHGCFVRSQDPEQQLLFVLRRFDLTALVRPFSRCMRCNEPRQPVAKADVLDRLPPMVRVEQQSFSRCPRCRRIYWPGSHWQRMRRRLATLLATARRPTN